MATKEMAQIYDTFFHAHIIPDFGYHQAEPNIDDCSVSDPENA
jgi:hypothetical protein